jgi:hypothetical protein
MFGMKRKAQQQAERTAAMVREVHRQICQELMQATENALSETTDSARRAELLSNAEAYRRGVDAVLVGELDAYGPELKGEQILVRQGAMQAQSSRNWAIVAGGASTPESRAARAAAKSA